MMHTETLEAIKRSAAIPSMPLIATRCYEMTSDPDCDFTKLVELLSTDPGIASDILRLSNSALFGVTRQVGSLKQAITLLGMKRVRDLVMARYLVQMVNESATDLIDINYFWRRSLTTGILSSKFADTLAPQKRDELFIGGLLADVGVVILAKALPSKYAPAAEQYRPHGTDDWIADEYNLMGVEHGEVSAMVLEQWKLPSELVEAVRNHHAAPGDPAGKSQDMLLAQIIGGASLIARVLCEATRPETAAAACVAAMDRVNFDVQVLVAGLEGIDDDIKQMADLLGVEVINSKLFGMIGELLVKELDGACTN